MKDREAEKFISDQLSVWPAASASFRALRDADVRELAVNGLTVKLQHNPARIVSSTARTDKASVSARPCFLCAENRPAEQKFLRFEGRKGRMYHMLVNPYPIFPSHLVIASETHTDQSISDRYTDMLDMAHHCTGFTFFYNGPRCGASAPDHMHFQACPRLSMPLECEAERLLDRISAGGQFVPRGNELPHVPGDVGNELEYVASVQEAQLFHYRKFTRGVFFLRARTSKSMAKLFYRLLDCAPEEAGSEPMFNMLTWYRSLGLGEVRPQGNTHGLAPFEYRAVVTFRSRHRPHHYFSTGENHLSMSPGCADMMGMFVVPDPADYSRLNPGLLAEMLDEVSISAEAESAMLRRLTRTQRKISVGIMSGKEIRFRMLSDGDGVRTVRCRDGKLEYCGGLYDELFFDEQTGSTMFAEPGFILYGVTIGVDFHWQRQQEQRFAGSLRFAVKGDRVLAINVIGVEDYLLSVISSEMKSSASPEFLKAHAVISRSWIMARLAKKNGTARSSGPLTTGGVTEIRKWFDHEDHEDFDVCADDHCQRYQGVGMAVGANVRKAVDETWGEVLTFDGEICDARFSKCCGGRSETFSTCWGDEDKPYLQSLPDTPGHEEGGRVWCDSSDRGILSQVLNDYDLQTEDFYTWTEQYDKAGLSALVRERSGVELGEIVSVRALERGGSGRISKLEIRGTRHTLVAGKELVIRRILSASHLKSSAFDVFMEGNRIILKGKGWGHGAGMCQIGAAVMAAEGHSYREIISHYYPGARITLTQHE